MRQRTSIEIVNRIRSMWDEGKTYQEIGEIMNYSPEWVRQLLLRTENFVPRPAHRIAGKESRQAIPEPERAVS